MELGDGGTQLDVEQLKALNTTLPIDEFARLYPYVWRYTHFPRNTDMHIQQSPTSGEHSRFGVFTHALTEAEYKELYKRLHGKKSSYDTILIKTDDLLSNCGIPDWLIDRGILVFPSEFYTQKASELSNGSTHVTISQGVEIDSRLQHEFLGLDIARGGGSDPDTKKLPIFTIPFPLRIPQTLLLPT
ncbi:hypothetical protein A3D80_02220 [Candidatus Roizmanbacteria bacterium RIFCSPHIGHO2_02_FULL_40_13b]|uniref:Uncharacterized protein n=1 Tax=Candidatus Roizmanbacteria bacterium RIFCSPHIGHO2_01_FULL_39_24 TaxID=1802032 RepID=A0A1F7GJY1_9BACT|nr:MAG: hypothetical protein A2799_00085 [Candidatus Roizmanbacteria bacterium RIFCSPHIGHO2_01_FULL_39_24]OGK26647.1 MAG: hypothetical protein A3D80_02220 [Candidatus Roizmanbacteria bacterium RIFCSPHIGHO2_02_FULL_40_13b]OGK50095.1 MAG: hypothetical protein A3A56_04005 [Candidatus Roizmanbacteria bacterium RIFCSPLOWO2_01_FULL_40_32]OGK55899.1 MAG: hypothetical protein A3H83_02240 [Candidatus Roizmanbacteria bacterium RIFCSPLOWO2_02_FULL_39_8]